MKQQLPCDDKALLIAYLYGECDASERRLVEQHIASCAGCAAELEQLRGVRGALREWTPPDQALGFRVVREAPPLPREMTPPVARSRWWARGGPVPAWAQLAAAVLLLAAGAAIGLSLGRVAPSRADLARLERRLERQEQQLSALRAVATAAPAHVSVPALPSPTPAAARLSADDQARLRQTVQTLVADMGRRQQSEIDQQIAQRFLRLAHDSDMQRIADQRRIMQGLNQIDLRTTQLSQVQNYLVRVANVK